MHIMYPSRRSRLYVSKTFEEAITRKAFCKNRLAEIYLEK